MKNAVNDAALYLFEVPICENLPRAESVIIQTSLNRSPQEILLGFIKGGDIKYEDCMKKLRYDGRHTNANLDLSTLVTPNLDKSIWYVEKELRESALLILYALLNIKDMRRILATCIDTNVCLSPSTYKVSSPEDFVKVINNLSKEKYKMIDFIPFLRKSSRENIKNYGVYHLKGNIKFIQDEYCTAQEIKNHLAS